MGADISKLIPFKKQFSKDGEKYFELLNGENASKMRSGCVTLKPGEQIGEHSTGNYEEMLVVLSGEGQLQNEKSETMIIGGGDIAYNPPGTMHNVINTGSNELKYIFVVSQA